MPYMGGSRGGDGGSGTPPPPLELPDYYFCHVEIFRQTPSGKFGPPPPPPHPKPPRKFSGSAHAIKCPKISHISAANILRALKMLPECWESALLPRSPIASPHFIEFSERYMKVSKICENNKKLKAVLRCFGTVKSVKFYITDRSNAIILLWFYLCV